MSAPIGPGDWLECIKAVGDEAHLIIVGEFYCVERLDSELLGPCGECGAVGTGFHLAGIKLRWEQGAFCTCSFRPVGGPEVDVVEVLKAPPVRTPEVVSA
jgi:hypothetical protein